MTERESCTDELSGTGERSTDDTEQSGLYAKYGVRKGGEPVEDCFVLEPRNDRAARLALEEYAGQTDDEELAQDLREWLASIYIEQYSTETSQDGGAR